MTPVRLPTTAVNWSATAAGRRTTTVRGSRTALISDQLMPSEESTVFSASMYGADGQTAPSLFLLVNKYLRIPKRDVLGAHHHFRLVTL